MMLNILTFTAAVSLLLCTAATKTGAEEMPKHTGKAGAMETGHLDEMQKYVTLHDGTEPPFQNAYWDHKEPGIYVDVISGEALFSSTDKFDSGTGWPSFTRPIAESLLAEKTDFKIGLPRTEVRGKISDAHLGHVFPDGPKESGGQRYCINSASLRFVPLEKMEEEGYGEYLQLFGR